MSTSLPDLPFTRRALYFRFFTTFFLRFPFFGCFLLPSPPPPLAIAARAVAALAAPRVCAACSARATTFRSGAPKTCGHTFSRKIAPRFMPYCSGTVSAARRHVLSTGVPPASHAASHRCTRFVHWLDLLNPPRHNAHECAKKAPESPFRALF